MVDGVGSGGYRDWWSSQMAGGAATDETEKTGQAWNAVFTEKKDNGITVDDFLTLMVAQLKNQDFMNPVDDTQYVTQLAQFATMQQMQDLAAYSKSNYVMSLIGKNVTAAKISVSGDLQKETGAVEKISLVNNEYSLYVNGKKYSLEQVMEIHSGEGADAPAEEPQEDPSKAAYLLSLVGRTVTVQAGEEKVTGVVEEISTEDNQYKVSVLGDWYPMEDVLRVAQAGAQ